jgi:hypothetical protein
MTAIGWPRHKRPNRFELEQCRSTRTSLGQMPLAGKSVLIIEDEPLIAMGVDAEGYEKRGAPEQEAERRAWATVNKDDGGGKKPGGSGRGKSTGHPASHMGGEKGGAASASRSTASRSASAKKAAATRKRNAEQHP